MSGEEQVSDGDAGHFDFAMGEHLAQFPTDRFYTTNHMWAIETTATETTATETTANHFRFGLTAYAVRLLQDVYFLDWIIESGTVVKSRQHIGSIESKKAESDLYAPIDGTIHSINVDALDDPSVINADTFGEGWLIEIRATENSGASESALPSGLLSPDQYAEHLIDAWDVAQRTIKGQANH